MKKRITLTLLVALLCLVRTMASPIDALLERIDKGASKKFKIELISNSQKDFFELDQQADRVVVRGNSYVNIAVGINWYLKYHAGIHLSWNQMHAPLPKSLPAVTEKERHETDLTLRYDFNYCTFSYSMAFWDWQRWQEEIDWMALHGINMPLAAVGHECVWKNMLTKLGYTKDQINRFIAGPAFLAWWEMNNLEGWGGPLPDNWYVQQEALQKKILRRMKELGMHPVLPGYSGMCPSSAITASSSSANTTTALRGSTTTVLSSSAAELSSGESNQSSLQLWNGFTRPGVLMPGDPKFDQFAKLFYDETRRLYGTSDYYSIDPFHEASNLPADLNIGDAGKEILRAMKQYGNEYSTWVVQGWSENPRPEMLDALPSGDVLILDLFSECRPQWGATKSIWYREHGYGAHDWCFCLLENFGANVGLHGRLDQLLHNFYDARTNPLASHLRGIGLTMEGLGTNPMMYELMCELPWRQEKVSKHEWIKNYLYARYGVNDQSSANASFDLQAALTPAISAWRLLADGILNCPQGNNQQGPHESIFCSRPSLECFQASSWSKMQNYYDPTSTIAAARLMHSTANSITIKENANFLYDYIDICRQAIADSARIVYNKFVADFKSFDRASFSLHSKQFLDLLLLQDQLLACHPDFMVGTWTNQARRIGKTPSEKDLYEWNARVQITTWGNRYCADTGGLRDYAHKEWSGILHDFYLKRWSLFVQTLQDELDGKLPVLPVGNSSTPTTGNPATSIDWFAIEEPWTLDHTPYPTKPHGNPTEIMNSFFK